MPPPKTKFRLVFLLGFLQKRMYFFFIKKRSIGIFCLISLVAIPAPSCSCRMLVHIYYVLVLYRKQQQLIVFFSFSTSWCNNLLLAVVGEPITLSNLRYFAWSKSNACYSFGHPCCRRLFLVVILPMSCLSSPDNFPFSCRNCFVLFFLGWPCKHFCYCSRRDCAFYLNGTLRKCFFGFHHIPRGAQTQGKTQYESSLPSSRHCVIS